MANGTWSGNLTILDIDASKLCPVITGTCYNELSSCKPGNVGIDTLCSGNGNFVAVMRYCANGKSCGSWTSADDVHAIIQFSANGSVSSCGGNDDRGRKLCKWFKPD